MPDYEGIQQIQKQLLEAVEQGTTFQMAREIQKLREAATAQALIIKTGWHETEDLLLMAMTKSAAECSFMNWCNQLPGRCTDDFSVEFTTEEWQFICEVWHDCSKFFLQHDDYDFKVQDCMETIWEILSFTRDVDDLDCDLPAENGFRQFFRNHVIEMLEDEYGPAWINQWPFCNLTRADVGPVFWVCTLKLIDWGVLPDAPCFGVEDDDFRQMYRNHLHHWHGILEECSP